MADDFATGSDAAANREVMKYDVSPMYRAPQ